MCYLVKIDPESSAVLDIVSFDVIFETGGDEFTDIGIVTYIGFGGG